MSIFADVFSRRHILARIAVGAVLIVGSASAGASIQNGDAVLSATDLIGLVTPVRAFRPKDAFDAAPRVDLSGRRFAVELPVRSGGVNGCDALPFWRYQAESGKLEMTFFGARRSGYFLKGYNGKVHPVLSDAGTFQTAPIRCLEAEKGAYRASNAFGATTSILRRAQSVVEIAAMRPLGSYPGTDFMMTSVEMAPADARQITPALRVRYEGRLAQWENGGSVACGIEHMQADMNTVWDTTVDTCIFRGEIEHIAFVDGRTGRVLAERTFPSGDTK